jgi:hypothetical protein
MGGRSLGNRQDKNLALNTMVGLELFGGGEALVRVLILSEKIEVLRRSLDIFLLSHKTICPMYHTK